MRNVLRILQYLLMAIPVFGASPCRNSDFAHYALPENTGGFAPAGFIKIVAVFGSTVKTFELEFLFDVEEVIIYDPNHAGAIVATPKYENLRDELTYICGPDWVRDNFPPLASPPRAKTSPQAVVSATAYGQAAQSVASGDFNGDGHTDAVFLTSSGLGVSLLAADGKVVSTRQVSPGFKPEPGSSKVTAADFNGDGKRDIAVSNFADSPSTPGVAILLGNGDGTFQPPQFTSVGPAGQYIQSIAAADFHGSGKIGLAVSFSFGTSVSVLAGNGNGTFQAPVTYPVQKGTQSLLAVDLNGDGRPDLATSGGGNVSVLLNSGGGSFGTATATSLPINAPFEKYYLAYSDLDHDGNLDLVLTGFDSHALVVLAGKGNGTFQTPAAYVVGSSPSSIAIVPLADGNTILFTSDATSGDTVLVIVGSQGTVVAPAYNFVAGSSAIAAGDLNGDGRPDVVNAGSGTVSVSIAQNGPFTPPVNYSISASAVAIGDLNGDAKPDVVTAGRAAGVLLGNGDGTLRAPVTATLPGSRGATGPQSLVIGDFNGDGKADVAVASADGPIFVLLGKGDGTLQAPAPFIVSGLTAVALATGDVNGDGKLDLAATMGVPNSFTAPVGVLAVFLGNGDGTFSPARTFPSRAALNGGGITFGSQGGIAIGDLNADGKPDIAMVNSQNTQVDVYRGDGAGGFSGVTALPSTDFLPMGLLIADLNADGKPDLLTVHCCGNAEDTYLLGNGDGTFQPEVFLISGGAPAAIPATKLAGSTAAGPDLVLADGFAWVALANRFSGATAVTVVPGSAGPSFGSGTSNTFTFTFSDSAGYQNLSVVDVLINNALDGRHACYVAFVPSGVNGGSVYLINDAGDAGGPYQGLVLPGSGSIQQPVHHKWHRQLGQRKRQHFGSEAGYYLQRQF